MRVIEVGFRRIQRGLIPFDLRIDGANLRLLHRQLRGGCVQILFRDGLRFRQRLLARQGDLSEITLRLSLSALSAQLHQRRFHFADLVLRLLRIDHAQQLAFFNLIANLNRQGFKLTADLRAHVNLTQGIQLPRRQHVLLQLARTNNQRLILWYRRVQYLP